MKLFRFLTVASLLASFTVAQVPTSAKCQMLMGLPNFLCSMPCCKTHPTVPAKCPQVRTAPQTDAIAPSTHAINHELQQVAAWGSQILSPIFNVSTLRKIVVNCTSLLSQSRPVGRAPPLEYITFSA
jgi:hypothetical protein